MAVVVDEESVVHVVVPRRAEAQAPEEGVPRVGELAMNQDQPVRVQGAESHVRPHVRRDEPRDNDKRHHDHARCVRQGAVKGVEEARVRESVMRLVGMAVQPCGDLVLSEVHDILQEILEQQLRDHMHPVDAARERVIRFGHPTEHPCARQVTADEHEALGLGQVRGQTLEIIVLAHLGLYPACRAQERVPAQHVVQQHEPLPHSDCHDAQRQAQGLHQAWVGHAVGATLRRNRLLVKP
mmetsp:Transcript_55667/g.169385  ORF Transcript_55667/g.169385 Transcript_55667/m.169385 type:complete len:239 (+) Transcript_55667:183-899(+)